MTIIINAIIPAIILNNPRIAMAFPKQPPFSESIFNKGIASIVALPFKIAIETAMIAPIIINNFIIAVYNDVIIYHQEYF
jgi:hypothetical protein